jgi:hypothetical protein
MANFYSIVETIAEQFAASLVGAYLSDLFDAAAADLFGAP